MKHIQEQIDAGLWGTVDRRLGVRLVTSKITEILINIAKATTALESRTKRLALIDAIVQKLSRNSASQG